MSLGPAVRGASRTLVERPTEVLPFYVASFAASGVTQLVFLLGLAASYLVLSGTGRLETLVAELEEIGPVEADDREQLGQQIDGTGVSEALLDVFTPTVAAILLLSVVTAVLAAVVVTAVFEAGQLHAVFAALRDEPGTHAGLEGLFRHWATFVGLVLLEALLVATAFVVVGVVVGVGSLLSPFLGIALALSLGLVWFGAWILLRTTFAFARPAAVVDDVALSPALRNSFDYVTSHPLSAFGYGLVAVVGLVGLVIVAGVFALLDAPTVGNLGSTLVLFPLLDLVKTVLYADASDRRLSIPAPSEDATTHRLRSRLRRDLAATAGFVRTAPVAMLGSVLLFGTGIALGLELGDRLDDAIQLSIETRLGQTNPVGSFFEYAANNWTVAAAGAFSGLAFGLPTATVLLFNGLNVGTLFAVEAEPRILVAFVIPHGLFEIPALLVSGALGLHLGYVTLRYATGGLDRARLADEVDRAFRVAVGLAVLLVVAAVVEAFVSPYYWRFLSI